MTEIDLEPRLRDLAAAIEFPPTPTLSHAVERRLRRRRVWLVSAAAAAAVLAIALAVPPARSALLDFFRVGGEEIHLVDRLPPARPIAPLDLGRRLPLARAERRAGFRALLPEEEPDAVYARYRQLSLVYGSVDEIRLLVNQLVGSPFVKKAAERTRVRAVSVGRATGFWISGPPHVFEGRYAGNVLVYARDGRTIRIEGRLTLAQALEVARSLEYR